MKNWLMANGLGEYAELFERERLTLELLPSVGDDHLKSLGLPLGDRLRVLAALESLKAQHATGRNGVRLDLIYCTKI